MTMKNKYAFIITISFFLFACGGEKKEQIEEIIRPVRYGTVQMQGAAESHAFSGTAQSSKHAKLSFKVAGTINSLQVKVGDKIRKGQAIASMDAIDYSVEYDQAVANLKNAQTGIKSAQSQLITTKSTYERVEKLYENNSLPLSDYEQAKSAYEAAEAQYNASLAQVTAAQKQVDAASNQVSYTRLTAPFSGIITEVNVEENELVNSGSPIAALDAETRPEVSVGIPEVFIPRIRKGQKVDIHFSILPNQPFKGTISEVGFSSGDAATYPVIVIIDNPSPDIRPGMAANVTFHFGEAKAGQQFLVAPVKAVGEGTQGNFVFILNPNGDTYEVKKQNIEIGELLPNGFEIKSGLKEGDLLATAGLKSLLDGMKVKLMEE